MKPLYEDNHLLACDKPQNIASEGKSSLEERAKEWLKKRDQKPGNVFLTAAHRIDKPVGGVLLFAKTSKALSRLHAQIRERAWEKEYLALVDQAPVKNSDRLLHFLEREEYGVKVSTAGQEAILEYEVVQGNLLRIRLITGRKHQIRAQLAYIGSPIQGDTRYGSKKEANSEGIDLHHTKLSFLHPVTKEPVTITSKPHFI